MLPVRDEVNLRGEVLPYLIVNEQGDRLCNDNRWRQFAMFGSYQECVKEYRTKGHAKRQAKRIKGIVIKIPEGFAIEAGGTVIETVPVPDKPGYVNYVHHKLMEYAIA